MRALTSPLASCAQLLFFVRYCSEGEIVEDFFHCKSLEQRTNSEAIFDTISNVFMASLGTIAAKNIDDNLAEVFSVCIKIVNFI
jgi:hypothetical protein